MMLYFCVSFNIFSTNNPNFLQDNKCISCSHISSAPRLYVHIVSSSTIWPGCVWFQTGGSAVRSQSWRGPWAGQQGRKSIGSSLSPKRNLLYREIHRHLLFTMTTHALVRTQTDQEAIWLIPFVASLWIAYLKDCLLLYKLRKYV